jgi:hypothetical protein
MTKISPVLFGGIPGVGRRSIMKRVLNIGSTGSTSVQSVGDSEWRLETKYFVAKLKVFAVQTPQDLEPSEDMTETDFEVFICYINSARVTTYASNLVSFQALILVFDSTNQASFDYLESWKEFVATKCPPIMICIANKIDLLDGSDCQSQRDAWLNWCLDNGFELIECSALKDEAQGTCSPVK